MKFKSVVEPPEPMRGLEVPERVVDALGAGKRPPIVITIKGHSWRSRVAIMRGRYLIGFSNANRRACGVDVGDTVTVEVALDTEPRAIVIPADLARAFKAHPRAKKAYFELSASRQRMIVLAIEKAKKPDTRQRRVEGAIETLTM
ncbi:MAG TPA: YdeI/OmpD-associated family protein [Acidimicrobiales bacterium]